MTAQQESLRATGSSDETVVMPGQSAGVDATVTDPALQALREILVGHEQRRLAELQEQVADLQRQVEDRESLIGLLTPVMTDAIRTSIRHHRQEMVEALYPIIGQLVARAVSEAIRDLARGIDNRLRMSFRPRAILRRVRAQMRGVSPAELALREALPFSVGEIFLIHRPSGLLLLHISRQPDANEGDADLIGGMLTAIRDFAQDAFGRGQEGQLDEIQYGDLRILIEAAQAVYLAVVAAGVEPSGFRLRMRDAVMGIQNEHTRVLRSYDGDASRFASQEARLRSLMVDASFAGRSTI